MKPMNKRVKKAEHKMFLNISFQDEPQTTGEKPPQSTPSAPLELIPTSLNPLNQLQNKPMLHTTIDSYDGQIGKELAPVQSSTIAAPRNLMIQQIVS